MMTKLSVLLAVLFLVSTIPARADSTTVTLNFEETNVLNGTGFIGLGSSGAGPMFGNGFHVLSILINWADTGTPNAPFPTVFGFEDTIVFDGQVFDSVCNTVIQTGPNSFQAVDCGSAGLQAPFVASVTYSGDWGSAEIGFGAIEPITINSTFTESTITPEPSAWPMLAAGLLAVLLWHASLGRHARPWRTVQVLGAVTVENSKIFL
jgi:hypothetical protein